MASTSGQRSGGEYMHLEVARMDSGEEREREEERDEDGGKE